MQWASAYKAILLWMFKNLKILFSCGRPMPLITTSTYSELWRRFRNVRVRPEVMCSYICVTTHSKWREDWCEWWTKMAANLNVFKTYKIDCILSKSNISFTEVRWVLYRIRLENKILKIWALKQWTGIAEPSCHEEPS